MAAEVNIEPQEKSGMLLTEPMHKMPHKIPPHKCKKEELKIKNHLKPYFEHDRLENLRVNYFRQEEVDAPFHTHYGEHENELPKSKYA